MNFYALTYQALHEADQGEGDGLQALSSWLSGSLQSRFLFLMLNAPREKPVKIAVTLSADRLAQLQEHAESLPASPFLDVLLALQGTVQADQQKWFKRVLADFLVNGPLEPLPSDESPSIIIRTYVPGQVMRVLSHLPQSKRPTAASRLLMGQLDAPGQEAFAEFGPLWSRYSWAMKKLALDGQKTATLLRFMRTRKTDKQIKIWTPPHIIEAIGSAPVIRSLPLTQLLEILFGKVGKETMGRALMAYDILDNKQWPWLPGKVSTGPRKETLVVSMSSELQAAMNAKLDQHSASLDIPDSVGTAAAFRYAVAAVFGPWLNTSSR